MIDRQTKQFMSKNRKKTQKHTDIIVTNLKRSLSISRSPAVTALAAVVAAVITVGATVVEEEVAAGSPLDQGRFSSFSANPCILKARPFKVGSLYAS
jgi:hypothetical protein